MKDFDIQFEAAGKHQSYFQIIFGGLEASARSSHCIWNNTTDISPSIASEYIALFCEKVKAFGNIHPEGRKALEREFSMNEASHLVRPFLNFSPKKKKPPLWVLKAFVKLGKKLVLKELRLLFIKFWLPKNVLTFSWLYLKIT